ncbi:FAD-binding domain-containing protein [Dendrothele bispora CBS 962.96]|uniref:FAD-binding domain-containing protein n=1 Tax=Dendrothele bispora (strain CBS 962.96) TaxID=1314807 RepID=A0A4V4HGC3_DENBC|nr:FAD-binding domain-containing protein [Dendrothele bispora CBS 962.96]
MKIAILLVLSVIAAARCQGSADTACSLIQSKLGDKVSFPGSAAYAEAIAHFEPTSSQNSTCSVAPTSADEVSTILEIVGREDIRAPFAVKASGHANNVGHSSTVGVQIALSSFTNVSYDPEASTATFGPGLSWDEIYEYLEQFNVSVVGGRVPGVGVGLVLGGGYSWITDQYGLGSDNIVSLDVVLPNGTFVTVTEAAQPDLMFGLRGGLNNFGVVTSFTVKAVPLSSIWGGILVYNVDDSAGEDPVAKAIADFSLNNEDKKSQLNAAFTITGGQPLWQVILFHDGPTVPDAFQPFLQIPNNSSNLVEGGSFTEFLSLLNVLGDSIPGGFYDVVPIIHYIEPLISAFKTQTNLTYTQAISDNRSVSTVLVTLEPFQGAFQHSVPSAYPHSPDRPVTPCNPWILFNDTNDFEYFQGALKNLSKALQDKAIEEGESKADDLRYPNYALEGTPLELMYGESLPRLREIRAAVDPENVMGLTGGWKL